MWCYLLVMPYQGQDWPYNCFLQGAPPPAPHPQPRPQAVEARSLSFRWLQVSQPYFATGPGGQIKAIKLPSPHCCA